MRNLEISSSSALRALRKPFGEFAKCLLATLVLLWFLKCFCHSQKRILGLLVQKFNYHQLRMVSENHRKATLKTQKISLFSDVSLVFLQTL